MTWHLFIWDPEHDLKTNNNDNKTDDDIGMLLQSAVIAPSSAH